MISVSALRSGYGTGPDVVHDINFKVGLAQILTVLGPNGCGKSTLLKAVAGLIPVREGRIEFQGRDVTHVPASEKVKHHGVGFVPQTDNVFASLSILENIRLGGRRLVKKTCKDRVDELFEHYPALALKRNSAAWALSGGERQILAIARALIARPGILLLDEPSAGLSPIAMEAVFDEIARVRNRFGTSIVMVEQNASDALRISDEALVLSLGTVALSTRASDVLHHPKIRALYLGGPIEADA